MTVTAYDNELVRVYHEMVVPSLVLVQCFDMATGKLISVGTAIAFAHGGTPEEGFIPYLATGARFPDAEGKVDRLDPEADLDVPHDSDVSDVLSFAERSRAVIRERLLELRVATST